MAAKRLGRGLEALIHGPEKADLGRPGAVSYTHLTLPTTPYV